MHTHKHPSTSYLFIVHQDNTQKIVLKNKIPVPCMQWPSSQKSKAEVVALP